MADVTKKPEPLTEAESLALTDCESIIESGLQTFVVVGAALARIRERRLYRESHETFEAYCQERWGWSDRRARQLIEAHEVVESVAQTGTMVPVNERQARALKDVPADQRATVLEEARADAASEGKAVTAERIRETAHKYTPMKQRAKSKPAPKVKMEQDSHPLTEGSAAPVTILDVKVSGADTGAESVATAPAIEDVPPVDEQAAPTAEAEAGPRVQPPVSDGREQADGGVVTSPSEASEDSADTDPGVVQDRDDHAPRASSAEPEWVGHAVLVVRNTASVLADADVDTIAGRFGADDLPGLDAAYRAMGKLVLKVRARLEVSDAA